MKGMEEREGEAELPGRSF